MKLIEQSRTIRVKDGYNGHTVEVYSAPICFDERSVKLVVVGKTYLTKWTSRIEWIEALKQGREVA